MSSSKPPASPTPATTQAAPPEAKFEWTHSQFEAFLERHFKALLAALGAVALTVGGWLVWKQRVEEKRVREGEAFAGAETLDDYKKVIANHPGSMAGGSAQFMIANLLAQNNDIAGALEELQKFAANYPTHPLADQAEFRIAVLTMEKGETKAGLEKLESFITRFPKSPFRGQALLRRADGLAATSERDKALEVYKSILADSTLAGNPVRTDAESRLATIKLKPPVEIEFVPEPPPTPPGATAPADPANPAATTPATPASDLSVPSLGLDAPLPSEAPLLPAPPLAAPPASPVPPAAPASPEGKK
jgi:predicted negative regulator of RcsB-dependent stress response